MSKRRLIDTQFLRYFIKNDVTLKALIWGHSWLVQLNKCTSAHVTKCHFNRPSILGAMFWCCFFYFKNALIFSDNLKPIAAEEKRIEEEERKIREEQERIAKQIAEGSLSGFMPLSNIYSLPLLELAYSCMLHCLVRGWNDGNTCTIQLALHCTMLSLSPSM